MHEEVGALAENSGLSQEARRELDRYLREREKDLDDALNAGEALAGKRWWRLIIANISAILLGALGVVTVAKHTAQSTAVDAIQTPNGIISTLVENQVESISSSQVEANQKLGELRGKITQLDDSLQQANRILSSNSAIAIQEAQGKVADLERRTSTLVDAAIENARVAGKRMEEELKALKQGLASSFLGKHQELEELTMRGEQLKGRLDELAELGEEDVAQRIVKLVELERQLSEQIERSEYLGSLGKAVDDIAVLEKLVVPIGGVIAWWGGRDTWPEEFELCDGGMPGAGSTLGSRKPDLSGRFVRGAAADSSTLEHLGRGTGGNDRLEGLSTLAWALTIDQIPAHVHGVSDRGHAHEVSDPGHAHRLPMGDGDGGRRDRVADGDSRERRAVSSGKAETGISVRSAKTGIEVLATGGGQSHAHQLPSLDIRPSYQELFYIIRVR